MSILTSRSRRRLPTSAFALPGRRYPIHDRAHGRNALARVAQFGTASEQRRVRAAVHRRFPDIGPSEETPAAPAGPEESEDDRDAAEQYG